MIDLVFLALVVLSAVYWLAALVSVALYRRGQSITSNLAPPVTILKPLRGDDGQLYENLRSFCRQDYPSFEIVLGVRDPHDPAVAVVERLRREFPGLELRLVAEHRTVGTNLKVSNLANLVRHAKHETLIVADSDMRVGPGYVRAVVAPLDDPAVGLVTCLYRGVAADGLASRLGAMFINEWFLPAALVGTHLERLRHAFGATIACRRGTLRAIGGFEALADRLADDYMLGWLVSGLGLRVVLVPYVVENVVTERSLRSLVWHELRWARTFRTLRPLAYFCSLLTYGFPLSAIWLVASGGSRPACIATVLHLGLRVVGRRSLYRALGQPRPGTETWLVPIRDVLSFCIGVLSFLGRTVRWNDEQFHVHRDGRLERRASNGTRPHVVRLAEPPSPRAPREEVSMSNADRHCLRTLFLHPPSYAGFDGGAGARYQARREIRSFWYPTWLAQPAALVPGSRLIDAPPEDLTLDDIRPVASQFDLAILHTSTPSFVHDVRVAEALKEQNRDLRIGFVGAHVAVNPERALSASTAIDFVARNEFDFTIERVARGHRLDSILGLSFRSPGGIRHTPDRPVLEDMDSLPFVVDVYKRDLAIERYVVGYLLHPYISLYTGRGCRSKCTFCLWPQTVGGHRYRTRSVEHVAEEIALATRYFPQVREYFFDDDTLTDDLPRIEALARRLGRLGVTWSCNAKANVPYDTLKVLKDNGLRLLLVGYESGNQKILNNVRKGIRLDTARQFTREAKALGIKIHGTFILGLPGETHDTIRETIRFARDIDPDTIQVSIAAPYPGTELFRQATEHGWFSGQALVDERGAQTSALSYPHLLSTEISHSTEEFYRRFYFRPRKIVALAREMVTDRRVMRRRLREGLEFLRFLAARRRQPPQPDAGEPPASPAVPRPAGVQVVLSVPRQPATLVSVPVAIRAAHVFAALEDVERVVFYSESAAPPTSWRRYLAALPRPWAHVVSSGDSRSLVEALEPGSPVVVVAPNTIPEPGELRSVLARSRTQQRPSAWIWRRVPVAAYYPEALSLLAQVARGSELLPPESPVAAATPRVEVSSDGWTDVKGADSTRAAEGRLLRSLRQPSDGYLARFDRAISVALSTVLVRTPCTPNVITAMSLVVGLGGAALLASTALWMAVLGSLLLWASCILDGCDGEVARLRLLTSAFGARFDTATDDVIHLATFSAIVVHVHRARPDLNLTGPALLALVGVVVSMASVWWLINRLPCEQRLGFKRVYERLASRDYVYLVMVLTAVSRLEWFLWAVAIGANLFWLSLWGWARATGSR